MQVYCMRQEKNIVLPQFCPQQLANCARLVTAY